MTTTADVVVATSRPDADAVEAIRRHHAELAAGLARRVGALLAAADHGTPAADARLDLVRFCERELLPHARAEEGTLYTVGAGSPSLRLLVEAMTAEHSALSALVAEVDGAPSVVSSAAAARALLALFEVHLGKENELLVPALAADPATSLASLLDDMHHLVATAADPAGGEQALPSAADSGGCSCGHTDEEVPELDVRTIPHAIRHATVFGAFDAIPPGGSLILVAPHDPQPLLRQLAERTGGRLSVEYLQRGPEAWRLALSTASH